MSNLKRILFLLKKSRAAIIVALVFAAISVVLAQYVNVVIGETIDCMIGKGNVETAGVKKGIIISAKCFPFKPFSIHRKLHTDYIKHLVFTFVISECIDLVVNKEYLGYQSFIAFLFWECVSPYFVSILVKAEENDTFTIRSAGNKSAILEFTNLSIN